MEKYFKKNMIFIVASLVFAVIALVSNVVNTLAYGGLSIHEFFIEFFEGSIGSEMLYGSLYLLILMIIIDVVFIIRRKELGKGLTLAFETVMVLLMIFNTIMTIGTITSGGTGDMFYALGPIMNLVIMFYWIQTFAYSDSVVKSKKDNDLCYYLMIGLVLVMLAYMIFRCGFLSCLNEAESVAVRTFLISAIVYFISTGVAYIFFAKAIENYQDELIAASESKREVRVKAGIKAAKTRKEKVEKTVKKAIDKKKTKKTSKK